MRERIRRLIVKELIQMFRNPRMRFVLFVPPLIQLVTYGYAFNLDIRCVATAVADFDHTQETREILRRLERSGYFCFRGQVARAAELGPLLEAGQIKLALQFDPGFTQDLRRGLPAALQILVDGTDSNTAMIASSYAARILAQYNLERQEAAIVVPTTRSGVPTAEILRDRSPAIDLRTRAWYNPDLTSRNFFVPGVIALVTMLVSLQLTAMAIVREREVGTMEQLLVTPLRPVELILGKTIPVALICFVDIALVTAVAVFWFGVPIRGSLLLLLVASALFLLSTIGIGLFISTITRTQQQAMMAMTFFFMPAMLISGYLFPIANMPAVIQYLSLLNPLRHFLVIVRGIFLKGIGPALLWPSMLWLLGLGIALLTLSALRFRTRLE
ncbi:MAG TPA: ABC transporter permease [Candidatus Bathyarchaeia archaeon]|nr:ABC transporter permease [Candidatus Bathyarchaeia archaeon]